MSALEIPSCVGVAVRVSGLRKSAADDVAGCHNADDQPRSRRLEVVGEGGRDQRRSDGADDRPELRRQWCPLGLVASTRQADTCTLRALSNSPLRLGLEEQALRDARLGGVQRAASVIHPQIPLFRVYAVRLSGMTLAWTGRFPNAAVARSGALVRCRMTRPHGPGSLLSHSPRRGVRLRRP
jgi:hypothetical protein